MIRLKKKEEKNRGKNRGKKEGGKKEGIKEQGKKGGKKEHQQQYFRIIIIGVCFFVCVQRVPSDRSFLIFFIIESGIIVASNFLSSGYACFHLYCSFFLLTYFSFFPTHKVRDLYARLLERTKHVKVWISNAQFEASIGQEASARRVYEEAYAFLKSAEIKVRENERDCIHNYMHAHRMHTHTSFHLLLIHILVCITLYRRSV